MRVRHIPCGPFANHSERHATEYIKTRLIATPGDAEWVLLTNLSSASGIRGLSEEFDLLAIGPTGLHPIEIKHWDGAYLRQDAERGELEAKKLNGKVKRLASHLRRAFPLLGFLAGRLLLTKNENEKFTEAGRRRSVAGIELFGLPEWQDLLGLDGQRTLGSSQVTALCKAVEPRTGISVDAALAAFGDYVDLRAVPGLRDPFHRVYQARSKRGRDRVVLHVYDLSATKQKNARDLACREFQALQKLQKSRFLPNLMDSFQEASQYPGEIFFFTYVDTEAPTLAERSRDPNWTVDARGRAALSCVQALAELHDPDDARILHRNLTPEAIRIRSSGDPLLTNLQFAKIEGVTTVTGSIAPEFLGIEEFVAPEVLGSGLGACTVASDIYSLCAALSVAFRGFTSEPLAPQVLEILAGGMRADPEARASLSSLASELGKVADRVAEAAAALLPVELWDEDTVIEFRERHYRILHRLGSGSVGSTFKVMEVDPQTRSEVSGPYVAKAITNPGVGEEATRAYAKVRGQTRAPHLAGVLEVAHQWESGEITALLTWVEGQPLGDLRGVLPLYLEDLEVSEGSDFEIAALWLQDLCEGLSHLHRAGLVHGDVSPKNIIVNGRSAVLTDYDLARLSGTPALGGTSRYCSATVDRRGPVQPSDDIFALAATFFEVLFDAEPFGELGQDKTRGLAWRPEREPPARLRAFFDRATQPDPERRFGSASEAYAFLLQELTGAESVQAPARLVPPLPLMIEPTRLTENEVPWLLEILTSYPASPKGNAETRGLDSEFSRETYVETRLDGLIADDIRGRRLSLLVLCGNAGDGKTAFLQNLASQLGCPPTHSAQRIWERTLAEGVTVRANFDGSAAYRGRSATEMLAEFLQPFQTPDFPPNLVHLLAINDGPLLAWLEESEDSWLTQRLARALAGEPDAAIDHRIRFIDLNARSLVGDAGGSADLTTQLLAKMLRDEETWRPCRTCAAAVRCSAWRSVRALSDGQLGPRIRRRLTRALQAVHLRGEVHVTARSLRATLAYIFFGTDYCSDLHRDPTALPPGYFDRAFDATSAYRQGDLLAELVLLDPAVETHPRIDRELLKREDRGPGRDQPRLASLRRQAYFQWTPAEILEKGGTETALDLARGDHLDAFLRVGSGSPGDRDAIRSQLCEGIARLEDLPEQAFKSAEWVPLRIAPRTPTETTFWVNKPRSRFQVFPLPLRRVDGVDSLHTHVVLRYTFADGHTEDLIIGADLFHLLMELRKGYQISDAASDDLFANLSIFKQRLAQEDDTALLAWNPLADVIYTVQMVSREGIRQLAMAKQGSLT